MCTGTYVWKEIGFFYAKFGIVQEAEGCEKMIGVNVGVKWVRVQK